MSNVLLHTTVIAASIMFSNTTQEFNVVGRWSVFLLDVFVSEINKIWSQVKSLTIINGTFRLENVTFVQHQPISIK